MDNNRDDRNFITCELGEYSGNCRYTYWSWNLLWGQKNLILFFVIEVIINAVLFTAGYDVSFVREMKKTDSRRI